MADGLIMGGEVWGEGGEGGGGVHVWAPYGVFTIDARRVECPVQERS